MGWSIELNYMTIFLIFALLNFILLIIDCLKQHRLHQNQKKNTRLSFKKKLSSLEKKETYDLRYLLIGQRIDLETAKQLLFVKSETVEESTINGVNSDSREINYIFDETKDETEEYSEYIVFRHKRRNIVAIYKIIPFVFNLGAGYSVESERSFWKRDFSQKLEYGYKRYRALKTLKKYSGSAFHHWLNGGQLRDGHYGIRAMMDANSLGLI